ncbi:MAG: RBBP9/YdeN family alpha/beta hydrolase [Sphingobacteriales bacterium]
MFQSTILLIPGIGNSGLRHWQTIWGRRYGFARVRQQDWETPACADWVSNLNTCIKQNDPKNLILVAHSAACMALVQWVQQYEKIVKGALLVAPADADAPSFPAEATGFSPVPLIKLPFPSIVVASTNDQFVTLERARQFAEAWGSEFVNIGDAGHINMSSGYGEWDAGLEILNRLDGI